MGVIASGPPFRSNSLLCKCGWMYAPECKGDSKCGLNQGVPEYNREEALSEEGGFESLLDVAQRVALKRSGVEIHTPYEFLSESAKEAAVNVVRDMIENSKSTQVGGTHYEAMPLQPWEVFRKINTPEGYCTYHINTVMAYLMRHDKKGGLTDIKKAADHLRELIRYFEEEQEYPF